MNRTLVHFFVLIGDKIKKLVEVKTMILIITEFMQS